MWRTSIHCFKYNHITVRRSVTLTRKKPLQRCFVTEPQTTHVVNELTSMLEHSSKRGMQVTWIGLISNVGLTVSKGTAGWFMNSASLLADATHSLSDLLSDFVTLYTFKMSRKVPDSLYPYGYGKYETIGSLSVSGLLIAGGFGIGIHSFDLLLSTLNNSVIMQDTATAMITSTSDNNNNNSSQHVLDKLDPNAAWFALTSVLVKEWLYRITLKVGKSERSDVLIANAWHHRSDAYSSFVALIAIGGTYMGIPIFDPLGGIVVSCMILKSGTDIMRQSTRELTDQSLASFELQDIKSVIMNVKDKERDIIDFGSLRGRKFGPFYHVDFTLNVNKDLTIERVNEIEKKVKFAIQDKYKHVQEIMIHVGSDK